MKNQCTPKAHENDCEIMAAVISAIGLDYGFRGIQTFLDGYETNDPDLAREGLQMMFGGGGLTVFAPLIQEGSLSVDQLLKYLDGR